MSGSRGDHPTGPARLGPDPDNLDLGQVSPIRVGELTFDVARCGRAGNPAVLMLHGFPGSRATFAPMTRQLVEAGLHLVVPDQRGYSSGARPAETSGYHIDQLVGDALGLLDALGHTQVDLVGHDWGAVVAWSLAARHPDRVRTLTALSVPHPRAMSWAWANDGEQQAASAYIDLFRIPNKAERVLLRQDARALRAGFDPGYDPSILARHLQILGDRSGLTPALSWYRATDSVLDGTPAVRVPTTFVWGADDPAVRPAAAQRCGEHVLADFRFVPLDGARHWLPELHSDIVCTEVLRRVGATR